METNDGSFWRRSSKSFMQRSRTSSGLISKPHLSFFTGTGSPAELRLIPEVCEAGSYVDSDGTFSDVMLLDPGQLRYVLATKMFE